VTDVNGNVSTTDAVVTVVDGIAPISVAQNVTVQLDANGTGSTTATAVNNGSSDACGIASMTLSKTDFNCSNVGSNTVTLTVTDVNGNVSTANATVTVVDGIAPVAIAKNISVTLANGTATITASEVNNGSTDACGIASMTLSKMTFTCSNIGTNSVTLTVTDVNGNISSASAVVTVIGAIPTVNISQGVQPGFSQGGAIVLTASSPTAISYVWTGGPSTASYYVYASGTYTVTAKNAYGCTVNGSTPVNYTAANLLSSYTIIGTDDVELEDHVKVLNGGVGNTSSCGEVEVKDNSLVNAAGTFVRAKNIDVSGSSIVSNKIFTPTPTSILPSFLYNPYCNNNTTCGHSHHNSCGNSHGGCSGGCSHSHHNGCSNNINNYNKNIGQNATVIITDSVMGQVVIGKYATVTFTGSRLYIKGLEIGEGATIKFTQCAVVRVCNGVQMKKDVNFNTVNPVLVTMYIEDKLKVDEGSEVIAHIYTKDKISIKGKQSSPTVMRGLFIGEKVEVKDYVNFYWNTATACNNSMLAKTEIEADETGLIGEYFDVNVYPNPSSGAFNVRLFSSSPVPFSVVIYDMNGRLVETLQIDNSSLHSDVGEAYADGMYFLKITQGEQTKTIRLVKTMR
ncbi:MAG: T9SS type A sorting domain-containing protein, partial [Bacteroidota bacterium]